MSRSAFIASCLLATASLAPTLADAQDLASSEITLTEDPGPIGIDLCTSQITRSLSLSAEVTFGDTADERSPIYRLYFYTGEETCIRENGISTCPDFGYDSAGKPCGCIYQTTSLDSDNEFATTTSLATAFDGMGAEALCTSAAPDAVSFFAEVYYEASGDLSAEAIASTNTATVTIDRTRPARPDAAPRVISVDGALIVSGDAVADADEYEVCVRQQTSGSGIALGFDFKQGGSEVTNTSLREGFTQCADSGGELSGYRFSGLTNNVNYEVVYAVYDAAGNRGPNSVSAFGQPVPQRDFAEQYTAQLGGQPGETGGCAAAPADGPNGAGWLMLGLLALIRRRRP